MLCPQRYLEVEFPLAKSAGAENVLLALTAGKGFAGCFRCMCHGAHLPPAPSRLLGFSCSRAAGKMPLRSIQSAAGSLSSAGE